METHMILIHFAAKILTALATSSNQLKIIHACFLVRNDTAVHILNGCEKCNKFNQMV